MIAVPGAFGDNVFPPTELPVATLTIVGFEDVHCV